MTSRIGQRALPSAPFGWDSSSRDVWNRLIQALEYSDIFDKGRRTKPQFVVVGTVSAPLTLDVNNPEVTALAHIVGKLLQALDGSRFVDVRE